MLKMASYLRKMEESIGNPDLYGYDPYQDPLFLRDLDSDSPTKTIKDMVQAGLTVGGLGKTLYNFSRKGNLGKAAPIIGSLGAASMVLDDYVQGK